MVVTQGCVAGALWFHKGVCSLKNLAEFCLASSSWKNQKSSVVLEICHNQNGSSCQHGGETFNFVGLKLKPRSSSWLSGAHRSPRLGLEEAVVALGLCAWHHLSKPGRDSMVHVSAVSRSQSRAGAEQRYLLRLGMGCPVEPNAALLITRLHPVQCHTTYPPSKKFTLSSNLLSPAMLLATWSDQQLACNIPGLLIFPLHSGDHVHVGEQHALSREQTGATVSFTGPFHCKETASSPDEKRYRTRPTV